MCFYLSWDLSVSASISYVFFFFRYTRDNLWVDKQIRCSSISRRSKQWKFGLLCGYIVWNAIQLASSRTSTHHSLLKYRGFVTAAFFKMFLRLRNILLSNMQLIRYRCIVTCWQTCNIGFTCGAWQKYWRAIFSNVAYARSWH